MDTSCVLPAHIGMEAEISFWGDVEIELRTFTVGLSVRTHACSPPARHEYVALIVDS